MKCPKYGHEFKSPVAVAGGEPVRIDADGIRDLLDKLVTIAVIDAECPTCGKPSAALSDGEGVEPLECFNCTTKGIKS